MGNRFNYRCPHCGGPDHIEICAFTTVGLTDSGAVVLDNLRDISPDQWSSYNGAGCTACGYEGHVKDFEPPPSGVVSLSEIRRR